MRNFILVIFLVVLTTSCDLNGYGPKVQTGGVEVYYKPNELKNQAQSLSVLLDSLEYGKNGTVSFQVIKDSIINLKMVTDPTYYSDTSMDYALNAMSILSQIEIFKDESVQFHICDETFNVKRSLEVIKNE